MIDFSFFFNIYPNVKIGIDLYIEIGVALKFPIN